MAKGILMPKQGITVESCILGSWYIKVGDKVKIGDILFGYETDKAVFEQESDTEGEVLALLFEEGDEVAVLTPVCVIGQKGEDISSFASIPISVAQSETAPTTVSQPQAIVFEPTQNTGEMHATPRARVLAEKLNVDLSKVIPTGIKGRITEMDVRMASVRGKEVEQPTQAIPIGKYSDEKMPHIRKVIAKTMHDSLATMAQLTHSTSYDATQILEYRKYIKENAEKLGLPNITLNDIVLYAVSRVLKKYKALNANLINGGETMRYFEQVNLGVAVDTPRGLLVPTLFSADDMTLSEISVKAKQLNQEAQSGAINPELLTGGTFTVTNLGSLGVEHFTPVINPPQTGILGVNTLVTRIKLGKNGEIIPYSAMGLSLTYDHRALDGAPASRFLMDLKDYLENFVQKLSEESKGEK